MNRFSLLSALACLATALLVPGCGSDNINDDFNEVALAPTATSTTTSGTSSSTTSSNSNSVTSTSVTTTASTAISTTTAQPALTLGRTLVGIAPTDAAGVLLFPASTVQPAANTSFVGITLTFALPATGSDGLTLTAPASSVGTLTGSGSKTLTVALTSSTTAQAVQDFVRSIRVISAGSTFGQQTTVSVTVAGVGQPIVDTGTSVRVRAAGALTLTVDPQAPADPPGGRFQTLAAAVEAVTNQTGNAQGSLITLVAGSHAVPLAGQPIGYNPAAPGDAPDADLEGLTLAGPNFGISAGSRPGTRGSEATITTGALLLDAPHLTLDGLRLTGSSSAQANRLMVLMSRRASDASLRNCILVGTGETNLVGALWTSVTLAVGPVQNSGALVADCEFTSQARGVLISGLGNSDQAIRNRDVVRGNYLHDIDGPGSVHFGLGFNAASNTTVRDNLFADNLDNHLVLQTVGEPSTGNVWSGNSFDNSAPVTLQNGGVAQSVVVNAANNWWNSAAGPNTGADSTTILQLVAASSLTTTPVLTAPPFAAR